MIDDILSTRRRTNDGAPYFPPPMASPGRPVYRVTTRLLPCRCRRSVIETCEMRGSRLGPYLDMVLDAEPVADGRYVVVENAIGGQMAWPFAALTETYEGLRRYNAHTCEGK